MKFTDSEINCLDVGIAAQNDEIERLRAFARDVLNDAQLQGIAKRYANKHGITTEYLKVAE